MIYSNNSDDAIRACEEARTGFYGDYSYGDSSEDESPELHFSLDFGFALREEAHQKAMREYRERWG